MLWKYVVKFRGDLVDFWGLSRTRLSKPNLRTPKISIYPHFNHLNTNILPTCTHTTNYQQQITPQSYFMLLFYVFYYFFYFHLFIYLSIYYLFVLALELVCAILYWFVHLIKFCTSKNSAQKLNKTTLPAYSVFVEPVTFTPVQLILFWPFL